MQNNLIDKKIVDQKLAACGISDMEDATIRDIVKVVNMVEAESGEKFIRMEMGVPGLAPSKIGIDAEIEALRAGCAQFYPMLEGHKEFKEEGSKFVKNFVDIDIKPEGIIPTVVTGSGQASLLDRLEHNFPGMFRQELMVTAFDVKYGKPNPEPYLMALEKGGLKPNEAIVIENAPLGVEAGHIAGIFTIAVNTGPLNGEILLNAGADLLFPSMQALRESWEKLARLLH